MRLLLSMFAYPFIVRAFLVGILVSLCASLLGVPLVLKRYSMIGDGLSHVSFGALSVAVACGFAPLWFSIPVVVAAAFILMHVAEKSRVSADAMIAVFSASALAAHSLPLRSRPGRSQSARGVRQGRLDDTLPSAPSLPSGDFYKPNPLDSDVIMDATARLLSSRRPAQQRAPRQEGGEGRNSRRGGKAPSKAGPQSAPPQKGAQQPKKAAAQEKAAPKKQQSSGSRRSGGHRAPAQPPRSTSYQKDSTEQHTLMRPYYLSDDR